MLGPRDPEGVPVSMPQINPDLAVFTRFRSFHLADRLPADGNQPAVFLADAGPVPCLVAARIDKQPSPIAPASQHRVELKAALRQHSSQGLGAEADPLDTVVPRPAQVRLRDCPSR